MRAGVIAGGQVRLRAGVASQNVTLSDNDIFPFNILPILAGRKGLETIILFSNSILLYTVLCCSLNDREERHARTRLLTS